jgi:hypothetical protein
MANRNTIFGFLRGIFAALIAMSVVVSSSVHAATPGDHGVVVSAESGHEMHVGNSSDDHYGSTNDASSADTKSPDTMSPDTKKSSQDNGSLCKVQCGFSMIMPLMHDAIAAHGRAPWATVRVVAMLPGDAVGDIRPPRS